MSVGEELPASISVEKMDAGDCLINLFEDDWFGLPSFEGGLGVKIWQRFKALPLLIVVTEND